MYRMINRTSGDHFYTISWDEVQNAENYYGYSYEKQVFKVWDRDLTGLPNYPYRTVPLYRLVS